MKTYTVETCAVELETCGGSSTWNTCDPRETVLETTDLEEARRRFTEEAARLADEYETEKRTGGTRMDRRGYGVELWSYEGTPEDFEDAECVDVATYTAEDWHAAQATTGDAE